MFNLSKIESYAPFCLSCLGRAFGLIGFGLDNRERGIEILNQLELQVNDQLENKLLCHSSECKICDGLISEISNFIDISSDSISQFSVETFKIGNVVDKEILERECAFQSIFGEGIGESLKLQLNREIGIGVFNTLKIEALMNNPDIVRR